MFDRNSFRPQLERLGDRINPADNVWLGPIDSFTTANYWSLQRLPLPDDTLVFRAPASGQGNPPLPPTPGSTASVTFASLTPPPPYAPETKDTYAGVRIEGGYTGTLTIPFDLKFGGYTQECGNTSTPGTNVTVTSTFSWTGGNLNTSSTAGEYRIQTPLGVIDPNGNMVGTGSTIAIQKNAASQLGSSLQVKPGTIDLTNVVQIIVDDACRINLNPAPKKPSDPPTIPGEIVLNSNPATPDEDGTVYVRRGGYCEIKADSRPPANTDLARVTFSGSSAQLRNDGIVYVQDRAWLKFAPAAGTTGGIRQTDGLAPIPPRMSIQAGCVITCTGQANVRILVGTLKLEELWASGQPVANQPAVTIEAACNTPAVTIGANAILTREDPTPQVPVKLNIKGAATVSLQCDGTLELYAKKSEYLNDKITTDGRVVFGSAAKIGMKWFNNNESFPVYDPPPWTLIESTYVDLGGVLTAISGNPTFIYLPLNPPYELLVAGVSSDNKKYQVQPNS
jgi:hypothetical protein